MTRAADRSRVAVAAVTALAYAIVGLGALLLAGPPGYAAPLYPAWLAASTNISAGLRHE